MLPARTRNVGVIFAILLFAWIRAASAGEDVKALYNKGFGEKEAAVRAMREQPRGGRFDSSSTSQFRRMSGRRFCRS